MGSSPSPPPAPDPVATAKAQGAMNKETAIAQAGLNSTNQITPDGSLTYTQSGTWADGTPQYTATTALSGSNQGIYDTSQVTKQNIANIGKDQSARIGDLLGKPLTLGNEATEARLMELGSARLTPQFAKDEEALRTRLANSGIRAGSAAFDSEMGRLGQNKNDAINQLLLTGRGQANQEIMAERNAPINEISALLSGSQVANPAFTSTPQTQVAGTDYAGMVRDNYNAQMQGYNAQMSQSNAAMGGMFGLAGTLGGAAMKYGGGAALFSDRRLKSDVTRIGTTAHDLPLYEYTIFGERQRGVMADEAAEVMPEAVIMHPSGYLMVNYQMLGVV